MENKLFLALGVLAIISGIVLIIQSQYMIGIPGSIVGAWLVFENMKKIKKKDSE